MSEREIIETRGQYRAAIERDEDAQVPDGDFFGHVIYLGYDGYVELKARAYKQPAEDFGLKNLWAQFKDLDVIREHLVAGSIPSEYDDEEPEDVSSLGVVDLDWFDTRDGRYVNVVTKADLKIWGWDEDPEKWPKNDDGTDRRPSQGNLTEFQSWVEGDCYGYVIEKAVDWSTEDPAFDDHTTWEEVDSCWGYYGDEYVKQAAVEALSHFAPKEDKA